MKRLSNLYQRIISIDNLRLADLKARKGKSGSVGVIKHDKNRDSNIEKLHNMLANHEFVTSDYHIFPIYKPKERLIYRLPYYPDRIVQHAVANILEPTWYKTFIDDTFCGIKGRGIRKCMERMDSALKDRKQTAYCLKLDIRKFYPSIDHDVLKTIIRKKIKCAETLQLLDGIIDSTDGIPAGNYLSYFFSNLYLSPFDHFVKEDLKVKHYYRYADDMVILSPSKAHLHYILDKIRQYLTTELKLTIKSNYQIFPVTENRYDKSGRGIDFVGYVFYHNQKMLRKRIKKNLLRKVNKNKNKIKTDKDLKHLIAPWLGWCGSSDSKHLLKKVYNIKTKKIAI